MTPASGRPIGQALAPTLAAQGAQPSLTDIPAVSGGNHPSL